MLYLVTYTLNPQREAINIVNELKSSPGWWHHLDYTWLIATKENINQLYSRLAIRFLDSDHFLILEIPPSATHQGWLPKSAWEWFNNWRHY